MKFFNPWKTNRFKIALFLASGALLQLPLASAPATAIAPAIAPATAPASTTTLPAPSPEAIAALDPANLSRGELSDEAYAFKQEVYRLHVARGVNSGRTRVYDLPADWLAPIPGTAISMRRDAAAKLGELLAAANLDLQRDLALKPSNPAETLRLERARRVRELGVGNAYRSASRQFGLWNGYFDGYYARTSAKRAASPGGEHGAAAAEYLREYTGIRIAAPGFSNHQNGIAVDLALRLLPVAGQPTRDLGASTAQADGWKNSWFWNWLKVRAGEFGFVEYEPEEWHWEFKPEQAAKKP